MTRKRIRIDGRPARGMILKPTDRCKRTLVLTVGTDAMLSTLSKMRGTDRSIEAERLMVAGMGKLAISWDGKAFAAGGEPDPAGGNG
jgi:hypothetical protein